MEVQQQIEIVDKNAAYDDLKKGKEGLIHISFSELTLHQNCNHRHLIEKYLQLTEFIPSIHLIFGNCVHASYESLFRDRVSFEQVIINFKADFFKEMHSKMAGTPEINEVENFTNQGINILKMIDANKLFLKYELVAVELPIYEVVFGNFRFKGFIDLILRDRITKRLLIADYKTSSDCWDLSKKKKDKVFMAQMRLYKYFFSRKFNEPLDNIDCKYLVLNRLQNKKMPSLGFGTLQPVEIFSTQQDIMDAMILVGESLQSIHIDKVFKKAKLEGRSKDCFFCPFKNNMNLCNSSPEQYKYMLDEHRERRVKIENGETVKSIY